MRSLKLILAATIFNLALSISSYAGDIGSPANPYQPPPPAICTTCDEETSTEMNNITDPAAPETAETTDFAVDIFLALLSFF